MVSLDLDIVCQTFGPLEKLRAIDKKRTMDADGLDGMQRSERDSSKRKKRHWSVASIWQSFIPFNRVEDEESAGVAA